MAGKRGAVRVNAFTKYGFILVGLLTLLALTNWPAVTIHYSENAKTPLGYILNIEHSISKGSLPPGEEISGPVPLFPGEDYFFRFDWHVEGQWRCFTAPSSWRSIDIYLDANGHIDTHRTLSQHYQRCDN